MATPSPSGDNPLKSPAGAESPTTVRPLEMDDEDVQDSSLGEAPKPTTEQAPTKPPRPLSPQQQAENTLKEAFPNIDAAVVKAVLFASGGKLDPAFNALLGMSDPTATFDDVPPPQPPRPTAPDRAGATPLSQLEADEQYARQLAEHYGGGGSYGRSREQGKSRSQSGQRAQRPAETFEENHSFLDDDLPVIKENLQKAFTETQNKVNGWITNIKKKLDGDDEGGNFGDARPTQNRKSGYSTDYGRRSADRRSGDYNRYDADPEVLGDDFAGMKLNSDGSQFDNQRRSTRPLANPDLFKPMPGTPTSPRNASFLNDSSEDLYRVSPKLAPKDTATAAASKPSKWQPLSSIEPGPIEAENDPFSLGDSEDEKETKERVGGKEVKTEDADRLKKAAASASASDNIGSSSGKKPEAAEIIGNKDKIADEKLAGKS